LARSVRQLSERIEKGAAVNRTLSNLWKITTGALLVALLPVAGLCASPDYPERPIRLIIGQAPGGATDIVARAFARSLSEELGQNIVVDNRTGAGGTIGATLAANAAPDGYTLLLGTNGPIAIAPHVMHKLAYDAAKDFSAIALFSQVPYIVVVHPSTNARTLGELVALARSRPGQLQFGSSGLGSTPHLCLELLKDLAGIDMLHVPYRGGALAQTDLMAGRIQVYCAGFPALSTHVRAGKIRALAVTAPERARLMPQLPTAAEAGVPGFEVNAWNGLIAPAKTPAHIIKRLHAAVVAAANHPKFEKELEARGVEKLVLGPQEFSSYISRESTKWEKVSKAANLRMP
jgi:tripartite-type tricarboxylate transporter receptor subunit TctC